MVCGNAQAAIALLTAAAFTLVMLAPDDHKALHMDQTVASGLSPRMAQDAAFLHALFRFKSYIDSILNVLSIVNRLIPLKCR